MGYTRKPDRFPGPLFLFSLGRLGACSLDNYTERCHIKCQMKALWMDPRLRELAALSALAALGCGLAAAHGDFVFAAIFGVASIVTVVGMIRPLR